jgi:hypothetical protein
VGGCGLRPQGFNLAPAKLTPGCGRLAFSMRSLGVEVRSKKFLSLTWSYSCRESCPLRMRENTGVLLSAAA